MATTNYTDYTNPPIDAGWLNDVDAVVYTALGNSQTANALRGFIHALQTSDNSVTDVRAGTHANRPSAGTQNRIYITTDSPVLIYFDNGTSWVPLEFTDNRAYDAQNKIEFLGNATVSPLVTLNRNSVATYVGGNGLIQTAARNRYRFAYDPATLAYRGLLLECTSSQNRLLYSEDFSSWTTTDVSLTANNSVAPDGNTTATLVTEDSSNTSHSISLAASSTSGSTYTFSVFCKTSSSRYVTLSSSGFSTNSATFNLSSGTVYSGTGNIKAYASGWYRCSITLTSSAATGTLLIEMNSAGATTYTGDGSSNISIWGAQFEEKPRPTSYIKTTGSSQTRAADVALLTNLKWFKPYGTLVFETYWDDLQGMENSDVRLLGGDNSYLGLPLVHRNLYPAFAYTNHSVTSPSPVLNQGTNKIGLSWDRSSTTMGCNGSFASGLETVDNIIDQQSRLFLGGDAFNELFNQLYITSMTFYPRTFSQTELVAATT